MHNVIQVVKHAVDPTHRIVHLAHPLLLLDIFYYRCVGQSAQVAIILMIRVVHAIFVQLLLIVVIVHIVI